VFQPPRGSPGRTRLPGAAALLALTLAGPARAGDDPVLVWMVDGVPETGDPHPRSVQLSEDFRRTRKLRSPSHVDVLLRLPEPDGEAVAPTGEDADESDVVPIPPMPAAGTAYSVDHDDDASTEEVERDVVGSFAIDYPKSVRWREIEIDTGLVGALALGRSVVVLSGPPDENEKGGTRVTGVVLAPEPLPLPEVEEPLARVALRVSVGGGVVPGQGLDAEDRFNEVGYLGAGFDVGPELRFRGGDRVRLGLLGGASYGIAEPGRNGLPLNLGLHLTFRYLLPSRHGSVTIGDWQVWFTGELGGLWRPIGDARERLGVDVLAGLLFEGQEGRKRGRRPTIGFGFGLFDFGSPSGIDGEFRDLGAQFRVRIGVTRG